MVPRNARYQGDIRLVKVEFRPRVDRRRQILIAFKNSHLRIVAQTNHRVETLHAGAHHIVELYADGFQHVHHHCRGGGFAVASADNHPSLVFGLIIKEFGVRIDFQTQFLRAQQLGIVGLGVHSQNNRVNVG